MTRRWTRQEVLERRARLALRLQAAAFVWSLGLVLVALTVPTFTGHTESSANGLSTKKVTLVAQHGALILIPLALPALATAAVTFALWRSSADGSRRARMLAWLLIAVLGVASLVAILSVGAYVLPVVVLLALAARVTPDVAGAQHPASGADVPAQPSARGRTGAVAEP